MDLTHVLIELRERREQVEQAIRALENLKVYREAATRSPLAQAKAATSGSAKLDDTPDVKTARNG